MSWLSDFVEYILPGEDKKGILKNLFESDDDYLKAGTYTSGAPVTTTSGAPAKGGSAESKAIMDLLFGLPKGYEATDDYPDVGTGIHTTGKTYTDYQDILDILESFGAQDLGGGASATYGSDDLEALYNEGLLGGGTTDSGLTGGAPSGGGGGILDALMSLIGGGADTLMGGAESLMNSKVGQLAMLNYLNNKNKESINVPIGQEAYGGGGNQADYRVMNLLPALMPGVAYANVAQPEASPPPPMRQGGIAGLASREGPGDITLAKLEPGEFVVTKKATDNIGAQNLYRMMKQAEGMG
jgi:hypothetical protein